ncbi:MAG: hypothetical protein IJN53_01580 [Oscillospiraceae bacterium]|nr:hypothetical protein [Oscillospiraceae bacterium]
MKKWINGRLEEMTPQEKEAMRQAMKEQIFQRPSEERLAQLEKTLEKLLKVLGKLFPELNSTQNDTSGID